jgi:hypothetical protein
MAEPYPNLLQEVNPARIVLLPRELCAERRDLSRCRDWSVLKTRDKETR